MGALTETLYAAETADSGSGMLKLVRLSLDFRRILITSPMASLVIVGCLSLKNVKSRDPDDEKLTALCERIKAVRDRLKHAGVWEKSISAYLPLSGAPVTEDIIVLTGYDKPMPSLFPGVKRVPLGDDSIDPYDDAATQARIVVDPLADPTPASNKQIILGYTLVPKLFQGVTGPIDPNNPLKTLHQFSVTITRAYHAKTGGGPELTPFQGSVTIDNKGKIVNVQAGVQAALIEPLLSGWIQVSGFAQAMAGANWQKTATGRAVVVFVGQGAIGGQVLLTPKPTGGGMYKFLREHVQIGIQGMGTVSVPGAGPVTAGVQGAVIVNIPFDL